MTTGQGKDKSKWQRHRRRLVSPWTLALLIGVTTLVPITQWVGPTIHRWRMISWLESDDPARLEQAVNFVINRAPEDDRVLAETVAVLDDADNATFDLVVAALDRAGLWGKDIVSDPVYLRYLEQLANSQQVAAREHAAIDLRDIAESGLVAKRNELLEALTADDDANVRYNAMISAASLYRLSEDKQRWVLEEAIAARRNDDEPAIARQAWVLLGLMNPDQGYHGLWRDAEPMVAQAMLHAVITTNPQRIAPAAAALTQADVDPKLRSFAAWVLGFSTSDEAGRPIAVVMTRIGSGKHPLRGDDVTLFWRAAAGLGHWKARVESPANQQVTDATRVLKHLGNQLNTEDAPAGAVLAFAYQAGEPVALGMQVDRQWRTMHALAMVEGSHDAGKALASLGDDAADLPILLRLAMVDHKMVPADGPVAVTWLIDGMTSQLATVRDLACVIAADRLPADRLPNVVKALLTSFDDNAKLSGAVLSGLTGVGHGLLASRESAEDVWAVKQVMRLGLWMQGRPPGDADPRVLVQSAKMMLTELDVPGSTVVLALLEADRTTGLDTLLAPFGEPGFDLVELLDQHRFVHVLDRYLPADVPRVPLWIDQDLTRYAVERLRLWYVLERARLQKESSGAAGHG